MKTYRNIILVLLLFSAFVINAQNKKDIQAKIVIEQKDNFITVFGTAVNTTSLYKDEYRYRIISKKRSEKENRVQNSQSGVFSLNPNETKTLCKQKLNIDTNSHVDIFMCIIKDEKIISKDTISIGEARKKLSSAPISETEFEISGMIVENVLSKSGKEFYEYFGVVNRLYGISYPYIITINEKPFFGGQNSEISVLINDEVIYSFKAIPKDDFLYAAALEAHKRVFSHYTRRKELYIGETLY